MTTNYSFTDACSIADYYERTGLYPKDMTHTEFVNLMTKFNLETDNDDYFIDPAGGNGPQSHI